MSDPPGGATSPSSWFPERTEALQEALPDGLIVVDRAGRILEVRPGQTWVPSVPPAELEGRSLRSILPPRLADDLLERIHRTLRSEDVGRWILERAQDGQVSHLEIRFGRLDDEHVLLIARDVTDQREEAERKEQRARELERANVRLQRFLHAASHDLPEPARALRLQTQQLRAALEEEELTDRTSIGTILDTLIEEAARMRGLVETLRTNVLEERSDEDLHPVDLDGLVEEVLEELPKERTEGSIVIASSLPVVEGEEEELRALVQLLLRRALRPEPREERRYVNLTGQAHDDRIEILVEDDGAPPETRGASDPDVPSLHELDPSHGSGGMGTCRAIAQRYGGTVRVEDPEEGSRVVLELPRSVATMPFDATT